MRRGFPIVVCLLLIACTRGTTLPQPLPSPILPMEITSSAFGPNEPIPAEYTCDGQGINPPLAIKGVSSDAKSLALVVDDPDAPSGTFVHWVAWNIAPRDQDIGGGSVPAGASEGLNSAGQTGYTAPCPPGGTHHYRFTVFALDAALAFPTAPTAADLEKAMQGHVLVRAQLIGIYERI